MAEQTNSRSPLPSGPADTRLEVTAQILNFEPGLYSVDVRAPKTLRGASGMTVPCIRLDPIQGSDPGRALVAALSETPLLQPGDPASYLRVHGGRASVLLTIYKLSGSMPAPELRIALVQPVGPGMADAQAAPALPSEPVTLMTHVERAGDIVVQGGVWAGQPGSRGAIEGFAVTPGGGIHPEDIEYQAVLGSDWTTPWLAGGAFCGSRGLSLPLLGVRIKLRGEAAKTHSCTYWGSFVGTGESAACADGAVCANGGAPLAALRIALTRKQMHTPAGAGKVAHAARAAAPPRPDGARAAPLRGAKPPAQPVQTARAKRAPALRPKHGAT